MITRSNPPRPNTLGKTELDVASTLINEANALLRQHGEDPHNDGTGDDLPVLTEVIFDLGESNTPLAASATPGVRSAPPPKSQPASPQASSVPRSPEPRRPAAAAIPSAPPPRPAPASAGVAPRTPELRPSSAVPPPVRSPVPPPRPVPLPAVPTPRVPPIAAPARPSAPPAAGPRPLSVAAIAPRASTPQPKPQSVPQPAGAAPRVAEMQTQSVAAIPSARPPVPQQPQPAGSALRAAPAARTSTPPPPKAQPLSPPQPPQAEEPAVHPQAALDTRVQAVAEELKQLDAFIVGEVETWMREELPALFTREIAKLNERLRTEAVVHLRTTLLPRLSEHIAEQVDKIIQDDKPDT
ncbi:MAG: hypothetical protein LBL48_07850 [Azoarcus sp.]|nr:hypothetical protein [Azoarcus sp.]